MVLVTAALVSGFVVTHVTAAWQNPTCDPNVNPDTCNAAAPINVSAAAQTKNGPLSVTVNTGVDAFTINAGPTGSPTALAVNSSGGGIGINVVSSSTGGALQITSTGATVAANIAQNNTGGTGLEVTVGGTTGGTGVDATASTGSSGIGLKGTGSDDGVAGIGTANGAGIEGTGSGTGNGVEGFIAASSTGAAGYFDGTNSNLALKTLNGQSNMTSGIANTPTLSVASTLTGATGPSAITGQNEGSASAAMYGNGINYYGMSGTTQSYNYAGVIGCYTSATNCGLLGSGKYAGYFNGDALVEQSLRVNSIAAADVVEEMQVQGQYSDNGFTQFSVASTLTPHAIESTGDYIFVCNRAVPYVLNKVRPSDGRIVGVMNLPAGFQCTDLTFDGANLWAASDGPTTGLSRVDPHTGVVTYFALPAQIKGIAFEGGFIWATGNTNNTLYKVNVNTGAIAASYPTIAGGGPYGITQFRGAVWWVNNNPVAGKYYLSKINTDGTGMTNFVITAGAPRRLVYDGDAVWVPATNATNRLIRFDLSAGVEKQVYTLPETMLDIAFDGNFLWLSAPATRRILIIRPIDGQQMNNISAFSPSGAGTLERIYFDGHAIWYSMSTDNLIGRYTLPWHDGYANGAVFGGISIYDFGTNTYTCVQSDGAGGIVTALGVCP